MVTGWNRICGKYTKDSERKDLKKGFEIEGEREVKGQVVDIINKQEIFIVSEIVPHGSDAGSVGPPVARSIPADHLHFHFSLFAMTTQGVKGLPGVAQRLAGYPPSL